MKVYIVTFGEYSEMEVDSVWSSKEDAFTRVKTAKEPDSYQRDSARVLECELDTPGPPPGYKLYCATVTPMEVEKVQEYMSRPANVQKTIFQKYNSRWGTTYFTEFYAKDEQHAAKIANERRRQALAQGEFE